MRPKAGYIWSNLRKMKTKKCQKQTNSWAEDAVNKLRRPASTSGFLISHQTPRGLETSKIYRLGRVGKCQRKLWTLKFNGMWQTSRIQRLWLTNYLDSRQTLEECARLPEVTLPNLWPQNWAQHSGTISNPKLSWNMRFVTMHSPDTYNLDFSSFKDNLSMRWTTGKNLTLDYNLEINLSVPNSWLKIQAICIIQHPCIYIYICMF